MPITSPVLRISGPRIDVDAREAVEREDRLLDREVGRDHLLGDAELVERLAGLTRAAWRASGTPVALLTKGTVRLARGFTSIR